MAANKDCEMPLTPTSSVSSMDMCKNFDLISPPSLPGSSVRGAERNLDAIGTALHVIRTERDALTDLEMLYESNSVAQESFAKAVDTISSTNSCGGRLIVSGVGKSGKIAEKCVATMNSFGVRSAFLHPTEALHGDLGMIGANDTLLIISFSGRTPELLSLLPHLRPNIPLVAVTSHIDQCTCALFSSHKSHHKILLPAPIGTPELESFGLAAPTTSTTVALALTDALALALVRRLHSDPSAVFRGYHPGGAIGAST